MPRQDIVLKHFEADYDILALIPIDVNFVGSNNAALMPIQFMSMVNFTGSNNLALIPIK